MKQILEDKKIPVDENSFILMVQDEGRFGRSNDVKKSWVPHGLRPEVNKQIVREYFYVYSAVAPKTGEMVSLVLPYANTEMMNIFLQEVSKEFPDKFIIIQSDQAGWHKSKGLKIPHNIHLIFQPPYSPELNPVEQIWKELRGNFLGNKFFNTLGNLISYVSNSIKTLSENKERIKSMTFFPHLNITF